MVKIISIVLILIAERFIQAEGDHEFKVNINIEQYHNTRDLLQDGSYCELFRDKCDPLFRIKIYNHSNILRHFASETFLNTNFIRQIDSFDFFGDILPEILTVQVEIFDVDIHRQEVILNETRLIRLRRKRFKIQEFSNSYSGVTLKFNVTELIYPVSLKNEPTTMFSVFKNNTIQIGANNSTTSEQKSVDIKIICLAVFVAVFSVIIIFLLIITIRNYSWIKTASLAFIEKMREDAENLMMNNGNTKLNTVTAITTNRDSVSNDPHNIYEECV